MEYTFGHQERIHPCDSKSTWERARMAVQKLDKRDLCRDPDSTTTGPLDTSAHCSKFNMLKTVLTASTISSAGASSLSTQFTYTNQCRKALMSLLRILCLKMIYQPNRGWDLPALELQERIVLENTRVLRIRWCRKMAVDWYSSATTRKQLCNYVNQHSNYWFR